MDEYLKKTGSERIELIDDELILRPPRVFEQMEVIHNLYGALLDWKQSHPFTVYSTGAFAYVHTENRDLVLSCFVPDLIIISSDRLKLYKQENPDFARRLLCLIPEVVIEVDSRLETEDLRQRRLQHYLGLGVKMIWSISAQQKRILIHSLNHQSIILNHDDVLIGGDMLPDLEIKVSALFTPL